MKTKREKIKTILNKIYGYPGEHIFLTNWKHDEASRLISQIKKSKHGKQDSKL